MIRTMSHLKLFRPDEEPEPEEGDAPLKLEEPQFLLRSLADMFVAEVQARDDNYAEAVRRVLDGFVAYAETELELNAVMSYRVVRNPNGSKSLWVLRRDGQWARVTARAPHDPDAA